MIENELLEELKSALWSSQKDKIKLQTAGINVLPQNFYSSVPSIEDIESSFEYKEEAPPYLLKKIFAEQTLKNSKDLLSELATYSVEFDPPFQKEKNNSEGFYWNNTQFSFSDAAAYYALIRKIKPKRIVEIGSGFSTLVAIHALKMNGHGELLCIDPSPPDFILENKFINLKKLRIQDVSAEELNSLLENNDILFIESTHTLKSGSDCLHIYLRLLPEITSSISVQVHDIFLPFALPKEWLLDHHIYWTEQYLLTALLLNTHRYEFIYGSSFHQWANPDLLNQLMHGRPIPSGGGSFWFKLKFNN